MAVALVETNCWPTKAEVPYDDFGNPVVGDLLEAWAQRHAQSCPVCKERDAAVDGL